MFPQFVQSPLSFFFLKTYYAYKRYPKKGGKQLALSNRKKLGSLFFFLRKKKGGKRKPFKNTIRYSDTFQGMGFNPIAGYKKRKARQSYKPLMLSQSTRRKKLKVEIISPHIGRQYWLSAWLAKPLQSISCKKKKKEKKKKDAFPPSRKALVGIKQQSQHGNISIRFRSLGGRE